MRRNFARLPLLLLALAGAAGAQDADPVADLRAQLAAYDGRGSGEMTDTIPIEKAILAVLDSGRPEALSEFAGHAHFGGLALAVGCEALTPPTGKDTRPPKAIEGFVSGFATLGAPDRADLSVALAALRTAAARSALASLAAEAEVRDAPPLAARIRAARLRAGDATVLAEVRKALVSKDADEAAGALLAMGDSRAPEFLPEIAKMVADARRTKAGLESAWPLSKTTTSADGLTTTTEQVPVPLATVGDVAVEAVNRLCASPLPGMIAWWAWPEKGARFERSAAGLAAIRALAAEDAKAQKASAPRAVSAVTAVLHHVRRTGEEGTTCRVTAATFGTRWVVNLTIGDTTRTASLDATGKVTLK